MIDPATEPSSDAMKHADAAIPTVTTSMRIRRAVPGWVAPAAVALRSRARRRDPEVLTDARAQMEHLLAAVRPEAVLVAANAYVERQIWRSELRYQPRRIAQQPIEGLGHLQAARRAGRGVVLNFLHHGHYEGACASVAHAGEPMRVVVDPLMLSHDSPAWLRQHVSVVRDGGNDPVPSTLGSAGCRSMLAAGDVVALASDVLGSSAVQFLGQERRGSSGAARIAISAGSPIVVMTAHRVDGTMGLRLSEPVEPGDFQTPEALLGHLLGLHEGPVLDWPEAYDQPLKRWADPRTSAELS